MSGPLQEYINIQPPKGGPPLEFINIQPLKRGSTSRIHQHPVPQKGSASRSHQPKGVRLQISSTKSGSASRFHQPKRDPINQKGTISMDLAVHLLINTCGLIWIRISLKSIPGTGSGDPKDMFFLQNIALTLHNWQDRPIRI